MADQCWPSVCDIDPTLGTRHPLHAKAQLSKYVRVQPGTIILCQNNGVLSMVSYAFINNNCMTDGDWLVWPCDWLCRF